MRASVEIRIGEVYDVFPRGVNVLVGARYLAERNGGGWNSSAIRLHGSCRRCARSNNQNGYQHNKHKDDSRNDSNDNDGPIARSTGRRYCGARGDNAGCRSNVGLGGKEHRKKPCVVANVVECVHNMLDIGGWRSNTHVGSDNRLSAAIRSCQRQDHDIVKRHIQADCKHNDEGLDIELLQCYASKDDLCEYKKYGAIASIANSCGR